MHLMQFFANCKFVESYISCVMFETVNTTVNVNKSYFASFTKCCSYTMH